MLLVDSGIYRENKSSSLQQLCKLLLIKSLCRPGSMPVEL